jgi:hypothetical protein
MNPIQNVRQRLGIGQEPLMHGFERLAGGDFYLPCEQGLATNVPPRYFESQEQDDGLHVNLSPTILDDIRPGNYYFARYGDHTYIQEHRIDVFKQQGGRYYIGTGGVMPEAAKSDFMERVAARTASGDEYGVDFVEGSRGDLMRSLPYAFSRQEKISKEEYLIALRGGFLLALDDSRDVRISGLPTPRTALRATEAHGLKFRMIREATAAGRIPVRLFMQAFADGFDPVGVHNLASYKHDMEPYNHYGGAIAGQGGQAEAFELLAELAEAGLERDDYDQNVLTSKALDASTSLMRSMWAKIVKVNVLSKDDFLLRAENVYHTEAKRLGLRYRYGSYGRALVRSLKATALEAIPSPEKAHQLFVPYENRVWDEAA